MDCEEVKSRIDAFVDGALPSEIGKAVEGHIASCASCTTLADQYRRMGAIIREIAYQKAPAGLAERIRLDIAREAEAAVGQPLRRGNRIVAKAAALMLVAGLSATSGWLLAANTRTRVALERDVVSAHVRSLLQDSPIQVASADTHTVKPWFTGRLDFAPTVQDLTSRGYLLKGGRLDLIGDRRVASVVYGRRQHIINLFMWPEGGVEGAAPTVAAIKGFNTITWTSHGIVYWAVSDLNRAELEQFQALI